MTDDEGHGIPEWFIPDGETVIGEPRGDAEQEHFEETGELYADDPDVCPHCGKQYENESNGYYFHSYRPVDGEWGEWSDWQQNHKGHWYQSRSTKVEPEVWCDPDGEKHHDLDLKR